MSAPRPSCASRQPDAGGQGLGHRIQVHFAALRGVELELPEPKVLAWADGLDREAVAITTMNEAEILHGLARLPEGRRKRDLLQSREALMAELFAGRIWAFSSEAAHWTAELLCRRERAGRSMATADAVIATSALAHGASP